MPLFLKLDAIDQQVFFFLFLPFQRDHIAEVHSCTITTWLQKKNSYSSSTKKLRCDIDKVPPASALTNTCKALTQSVVKILLHCVTEYNGDRLKFKSLLYIFILIPNSNFR